MRWDTGGPAVRQMHLLMAQSTLYILSIISIPFQLLL